MLIGGGAVCFGPRDDALDDGIVNPAGDAYGKLGGGADCVFVAVASSVRVAGSGAASPRGGIPLARRGADPAGPCGPRRRGAAVAALRERWTPPRLSASPRGGIGCGIG